MAKINSQFNLETPAPDENPIQSSWPFEVLKQFRLIFKATQQHSQWVESQYGVTSAQLWAIWEISKSAEMKVTHLAKAMSIHHSTVCSLLDKLVKKKLVERKRVSQDQRVVTLCLTKAGASIAEKVTVTPQGVLQHAIFELSEDAVKTLATHLTLLVNAMNIHDEEAEMEPINAIPKRQKALKKINEHGILSNRIIIDSGSRRYRG